MNRRNCYVAAFVGASIAYIFTALAFTGTFEVSRWAVFVVVFFGGTYGFERFSAWAEALED